MVVVDALDAAMSRAQRLSVRAACAMPHVAVELSMQPVVVYVARELTEDRCRQDVTRGHEQKHLEVIRATLDESAQRLRDRMPARLGTAPLQGASGTALSHAFDTALRGYLSTFMREQSRLLAERQADIDSPQEYARVAGACRAH